RTAWAFASLTSVLSAEYCVLSGSTRPELTALAVLFDVQHSVLSTRHATLKWMQNFQTSSSAEPEEPPEAPIAVQEAPGVDALPPEHVVPPPPDSSLFVQAWDAHTTAMQKLEERRQKQRSLRLVREIVETGILALVIFLGVRAVVQNFRVEGLSMDPT